MSMAMTLAPSRPVARIGPNVIIQVAAASRAILGERFADALVRDATPYTLQQLPGDMIDQREAQAIVRELVGRVGARAAVPVLREAGERTADYLLAHRIPRAAQWVMRALPRGMGLSLLLRAMSANAWTFAGSGEFRIVRASPWPLLEFTACAMCDGMHEDEPMCHFYGGTFERLIRRLIASAATVREVECMAQGGDRCRFEIALP
jgi:divinyl protochlorophyllide a 8-vinyl-reductase